MDMRLQDADEVQGATDHRWSTEGIEPLSGSFKARLFLRIIEWAERLNIRQARLGSPPVYDKRLFPWLAAVEARTPLVRAELERVLERQAELPAFNDIMTDVATISKDKGWKSFVIAGMRQPATENVRFCPETWRTVQMIPGMMSAMFSIFEPGKHLPPHRGPYNGVLRLHLGLIVPEPREDVAIRVGEEIVHWREGEAVIFDDSFEHEAWNNTKSTRVVLFVDIARPLRFPASLLNGLLLRLAAFTPFIREGAERQRQWEQRFYGKGG